MDRDLEGLYSPPDPDAEPDQNGMSETGTQKANGKGHDHDLEKGVSTDVRAAPAGDSTYSEPAHAETPTVDGEHPR